MTSIILEWIGSIVQKCMEGITGLEYAFRCSIHLFKNTVLCLLFEISFIFCILCWQYLASKALPVVLVLCSKTFVRFEVDSDLKLCSEAQQKFCKYLSAGLYYIVCIMIWSRIRDCCLGKLKYGSRNKTSLRLRCRSICIVDLSGPSTEDFHSCPTFFLVFVCLFMIISYEVLREIEGGKSENMFWKWSSTWCILHIVRTYVLLSII